MDEQRIQGYLNLIQTLLNCPNGKEVEILHRHSNLVDEGLVRVMELVAEDIELQHRIFAPESATFSNRSTPCPSLLLGRLDLSGGDESGEVERVKSVD
ncbi:hypothetical protein [Coleofasciculus sp.]|uniref:hypothetical protein n=1 Tax=Coleofasciculus sp. TaxID=3100458 RepID=UPI0039F88726